MFFFIILHDDRRILIRTVSLTNGSECVSARSKIIRILRIRIRIWNRICNTGFFIVHTWKGFIGALGSTLSLGFHRCCGSGSVGMFLGPSRSASGSVSHKYGSGSEFFHHQAKIVRITLISTVLWLLHEFLTVFRIRTKISRIHNTGFHGIVLLI